MPHSDASRNFSFNLVFTNLLQRFLRGGGRKAVAVKSQRGRTRRGKGNPDVGYPYGDVEKNAVPLQQRVLVQEGVHSMMPSGGYAGMQRGYDGYGGYGDDDEYAVEMAQMMKTTPGQDAEQLRYQQMLTIRDICHATSLEQMQAILDWKVSDDWLGGLDALPGNIYLISALNCRCPRSLSGFAKKLGHLSVFLIQLCGPPFIFFQYWCGYGLEDHEQLHWDKFTINLSDWYPENKYYLTKITAVLFLGCFCLNGLFCHLDERNAWLKVDRIINILNYNGRMRDTCDLWLKVGAFMNSWVIFWLCLDVFLVLGTSGSVVEVIFDALALAFLYNLDDVASDLRFVDDDDWPGLQLAWVDKNIGEVAAEFQDIDETEPSIICNGFLTCCAGVLMIFCVVLPTAFIIVPFKELRPDPFFQSITQEYLDTHYVKNLTAVRLLMNSEI